jgi:hypothetical protein
MALGTPFFARRNRQTLQAVGESTPASAKLGVGAGHEPELKATSVLRLLEPPGKNLHVE